MLTNIALLSVAGALGTLCRYGLSGAVYAVAGRDFPWGTWAVNLLGCLLFGLVWVLAEERGALSAQARTLVLVGFMGAFTTFSTLVFESAEMVRDGQWLAMGLNLAGQNALGFAAFYLGVAAGRTL